MPSTYTVNLGIEKPATGEQSGTWGDTTNINFDILDQAINGCLSLTLASAGTSGSPNTLAISDGATSDGRNKWIEFVDGGDLGATAYVQLTPNDAEKIVFIRNSLSGSRSVILFQGTYDAGRDLEVPAGVDMVVKFSGGGATATTTDVFTKLRATEITTPTLTAGTADINDGTVEAVIGGTTPKAGTFTTLTANTNLTINATTTVDGVIDDDTMATASATKLSTSESIKAYVDTQVGANNELSEVLANGNTTGANNIIVDNGQAITTNTINETTAGSGVTIDSVLLKDDGVNATNLEITNLKANDGTAAGSIANSTGAVTITSFISNSVDIGGGAIDGTNIGASSAGSGAFTTLSATGDLTVDTDTLYVDSTNDRVGINDSTPTSTLDITANVATGADFYTDANTNLRIVNTDSGNIGVFKIANETARFVYGQGTTSDKLIISSRHSETDSTEFTTIDNNGFIIQGYTSSITGYRFQSAYTSGIAGGSFIRFTNDAYGPYLNLTKSRGTTVPTNTIVQDDDALGYITFAAADGVDFVSLGAQIQANIDGTPGANDTPGRLVFSTTADGASAPTERMRITSAGLIGLATTSPTQEVSVGGNIDLQSLSGGNATLRRIAWRNTNSSGYEVANIQGYTGTNIYEGQIAFQTKDSGGTMAEAMRIDSSQRVLIDATSSTTIRTRQSILQSNGTSTNAGASFTRWSDGGGGPYLTFAHSRSATVNGGFTILQADDAVGSIDFAGADGNDLATPAATITVSVDGTPGSNDMPGRLVFSTTGDGASSVTERWRISSTGNFLSAGGYLIGVNTSDGSDNSYIAFGAGSGESDGRGAIIRAYGNEHASNAGLLSLSGGNVTGGAISFRAGGTDAMKVDDNGTVLVGFTADNSTQGGRLQVNTDAVIRRNLAGSGAGALRLEHNRSNTDGNFTVVQSGDKLGEIQWYGSDSVDFALGAQLIATVDGGAASNDMPTRLSFLTAADGTASPTEHMRISENGHIGMGNSPVGSFDSEKVFINTDGSFGTEIALSLNNPRAYGIGLGTSAVALDFVRARSTGDDNYQMARITGYNEAETSSADGGMAIYTRNGGSLVVAINITSDGDVSNRQNSDGGGTNAYQIGASVAGNYMSDANGATEARIKSARFPGTGGGVTSGAGWVITTGANTYAPYGKDTDDPTVAIQSRGMQIVKGGIQFGNAVGSWTTANVLDDYEEGTWTPIYTTDGTDFSSVTYNTGVTGGKYVKVGGMVYASGTLYTNSVTVGSASGTVRVGGLPFTIAANTGATQNGYTAAALGEGSNFAGDVPAMGRGVPTTTVFDLFYKTASNGPTSGLQVADMGTGANNNLLRFTIVYVAS